MKHASDISETYLKENWSQNSILFHIVVLRSRTHIKSSYRWLFVSVALLFFDNLVLSWAFPAFWALTLWSRNCCQRLEAVSCDVWYGEVCLFRNYPGCQRFFSRWGRQNWAAKRRRRVAKRREKKPLAPTDNNLTSMSTPVCFDWHPPSELILETQQAGFTHVE